MSKLGFFTRHAEAVRKTFGVIILLAVAFIASGTDAQSLFAKKEAAPAPAISGLQEGLANPYPAPEFAGISTWLNSPPLSMASLKGKVVLVDFWTYSCINCIRTLPYITQWDRTYREKGLVVIGVHAPEFEFEKDVANVKNALAAHHIDYPVAIDNRLDTWTAFRNRYWPAHYLINQEGKVVYIHFGEGNYGQTENNIRQLLGLDVKPASAPQAPVTSANQTPETYLGSARAQYPSEYWSLAGAWRMEPERIVSDAPNATLQLNFTAGKVFLVLGTRSGQPITAHLMLNGKPLGEAAGSDVKDDTVTVASHRLYELVRQPVVGSGLLEITTDEVGLEAYAFTFGK